jgi:pimeloyl-ACP methyl ester carboxylesterase
MREHQVQLPSGLNVCVQENGAGIPVLLVHGNWSTRTWLLPTLERVPAGYRAIAYDLRGRGKTVGPHTSYSIASLATDLQELADALSLSTLHVVGHSLGSAIAMEFARSHDPRLLSLTAVSPAWIDGIPEKLYNHAAQSALKADRALFGKVLRPLAPSGPFGQAWEALVTEGHSQAIEATLANLDALREWRPGSALGDIRVPCTVISGAKDTLVDKATVDRVTSVLRAKHIVLEGVGHCAPIEAPHVFAETLFRSLAAIPV